MKYLKTLPIVLFFILSFFLYWKITHIKESKELSSALLNKDLPILPLEFFEGNISLNDIYKKEPFIINYFASWCAPCRVEHKVLDKFSRDNIIIGIAYKDSKKNVKSFLEELGNPYKEIFIFDVTRRSNTTKGANNVDGARRPAERAHVDYTEDSAPKRALDIMGNNYYNKVLNTKRIMQLNVWFPLSAIVLSSPLAFADYRSISLNDLVATDQHFPKRVGEIYHLAYNKKQQWYWLPDMKNNELIILKGWDSLVKSSISRFTPHTSFNLKAQDTIKFPRESIEIRVFLVI